MKDPNKRPNKVCSPRYAVIKAKKGIQLSKWELEELAKSPKHSVEYCEITGRDFPECEPALWESGASGDVYRYWFTIAKRPSPELEKAILSDQTQWIPDYAANCLNGRWAEGEKLILSEKQEHTLLEYQGKVIKGRWKEMEFILWKKKKFAHWSFENTAQMYFHNCGKRDEDLEATLLQKGKSRHLYWYARECVKGRLPQELHNKMILLSFEKSKFARKYLKELDLQERRAINYLKNLSAEERVALLERAS